MISLCDKFKNEKSVEIFKFGVYYLISKIY